MVAVLVFLSCGENLSHEPWDLVGLCPQFRHSILRTAVGTTESQHRQDGRVPSASGGGHTLAGVDDSVLAWPGGDGVSEEGAEDVFGFHGSGQLFCRDEQGFFYDFRLQFKN
jgi:hypothetical protein